MGESASKLVDGEMILVWTWAFAAKAQLRLRLKFCINTDLSLNDGFGH